ncbi:sugar-phosphatase [Bacillus sp. B15-48]|uniref:sugar-phosphatase n=1 Tax=Bacillus sp. B15-48 TaxID=1548601 RepID=UPI00193EECDF|nr:sugar-phosphatase [Bacillus sp. B15-48]MBM4761105.1 sugar-phosphatase [Bacillus sp. B15-48]
MYKLIAIDLDGTLLNDEHEITPEVQSAVLEARAKGIKIVLCSGRPIGGILRFVEELGLNQEDDYVVSFNGAYILNTYTNEPVQKLSLGYEDLKRLYQLSIDLDASMQYFDLEKIYTLNKDIHRHTVFDSYLTQVSLHYRTLEEIPKDVRLQKVMFVDEPDRIIEIIHNIPTYLKELYMMQRSAPFFYEFVHPNATKGKAIQFLAKRLGIQRSEVMCIGDQGNDVTMIQFAGCGVAMENAIPELKKIANFQTLSNNSNGVAHAIREFVLK